MIYSKPLASSPLFLFDACTNLFDGLKIFQPILLECIYRVECVCLFVRTFESREWMTQDHASTLVKNLISSVKVCVNSLFGYR